VGERSYFVYILSNASRMLYTGVTGDLEVRVHQHKGKETPGFTEEYNVTRLVYYELFGDIRAAISREKQIKGWLRTKKIGLVESLNPEWRDLAAELLPKRRKGC
jgi:putative endonuclease